MNTGVPSIAEGRIDHWRVRAGSVEVFTEGGERIGHAEMPTDLELELARELGRHPLGWLVVSVLWLYPTPEIFGRYRILEPGSELHGRALAWYAGELHRGAQR